jgi:hypothetical protein
LLSTVLLLRRTPHHYLDIVSGIGFILMPLVPGAIVHCHVIVTVYIQSHCHTCGINPATSRGDQLTGFLHADIP